MSNNIDKLASKESALETTQKVADDYNGAYNEEDYIDTPPDGGYGWVCCACISAMNFATWGANGSFGVMLTFFLENDEFPGATATDYALIVGLLNLFTLGTMSIASVMLFVLGYKTTVTIGIVIQLAAYIGASFAKTIGQIQATQGVLLGLSFGIIFGANSIVLPSWFLQKRAVANGFSHLGLGLGGMTFSLVNNALIQRTGNHKWALRALGIISTLICTVTMFLVKIRTPKNSHFKENPTVWDIAKKIYDWKVIKSYPLQLVTVWALLSTMAYAICLFSLSNYARSLGYTSNQATTITVLLNLSQGFGRPLIGILSEIFGRINFTMFSIMYTCVLVFVFWINLTNYASLIIFALMLGLFIGISSVGVVPLTVDVVGLNAFPAAFSYINLFVGSSILVSEVIALDLRDYSLIGHTPYFHCQLFVGSIYFVAFLILIPYREWRIQRMITQLQNSDSLDDKKRQEYELLQEKGFISWWKRAFHLVKI
uniref:MFS transporter n=1 Tax=Cyberlindnera americana TaxID=36016 RepID=A0A5P8N8J7_9ASCO|nr:MFS transporter [Cyberlindnera americana]